MAEKMDKLFSEYDKALQHEKKDTDDRGLAHQGDGGEDSRPSPSSSDSSHHSNCDSRHTYKKYFIKLDVKFDFPMYVGECNA